MEKQEIEKIKNQIEKAQKYLLSFSGNERKTYAVKQRIFKLKDKIGDTSPTYQLGPYGPFVSRQEIIMKSKTEYHANGNVKSIIYYLGNNEFDQIFYDEKGEFESHIMLYDYGIRDTSEPLF